MPRIRSIKPEFWADEKLSPMPDTVRLVFLGLISMADDYGRVVDSEKQIEAFIWPHDNRTKTLRESLANLSRIGRIRRGKAENGQRIIEIVNWSKHQRVDHPNEKAALPQIVEESPLPAIREPFANTSREIREPLATDLDLDLDQDRDQDHDLKPSRRRAKKPREASAELQPSWVQVLTDVWIDKVGNVTHPRLGKALKAIAGKHAVEDIVAAIAVYASDDEGPRNGVRKVEFFAEDFQRWLRIATTPLVDGAGILTERGRRVGSA